MTEQQTLPKGLGILKGFSVFDPGENIIRDLKRFFGINLDFVEDNERILWIGAPSFRYFFVSFGSSAIYVCVFYYICFIISLFFEPPRNLLAQNARTIAVIVGPMIVFSYFIFMSMLSVGLMYAVTTKRIVVTYAKRFPLNLNMLLIRSWAIRRNKTVFYDCGYIVIASVSTLSWTNIGIFNFSDSVDDHARVINNEYSNLKYDEKNIQYKVKKVMTIQPVSFYGAQNCFVAIQHAERVANIVAALAQERVLAPDKCKWYEN